MEQQTVIAEILAATNDVLALVEAPGAYYYEDVVYKRWWLGPGGRAGNCDECIENADAGEIEEDDFFPAWGAWGPVDEPPLHPHCYVLGHVSRFASEGVRVINLMHDDECCSAQFQQDALAGTVTEAWWTCRACGCEWRATDVAAGVRQWTCEDVAYTLVKVRS